MTKLTWSSRAVLATSVVALAATLLPGSPVQAIGSLNGAAPRSAEALPSPPVPTATTSTPTPTPTPTPTSTPKPPPPTTPPTPGYSPVTGPVFNNPYGTPEQQYAIVAALQANIANAPAGSVIQLVTYSYVLQRVTDDLLAAYDRGVVVQAIIDDRSTRWRAATQLAEELDVDQTDASWVKFAHGSTRVRGGNVHQKTWRFSQVGAAQWVTMVGSTNLSNPGNEDEWSDMMVWANRKDVWDTFNRVFAVQSQMTQAVRQPYLSTTMGYDTAYFLPMRGYTRKKDPVLKRIAAIPPRGAYIRVAQYSWWGSRGAAIARALAAKRRAGAKIEAIIGPSVSPEVVRILRRAKVRIRNGVMPDGKHIHHKLMIATYKVNHGRRWMVWTGSDNWANESMGFDEAVVGIRGLPTWRQYAAQLGTIPRVPR